MSDNNGTYRYESSNSRYYVIVDKNGPENYGVYNSDFDICEHRCKTLPQAIGIAEQFDFMLSHDTWRDILTGTFGTINVDELADADFTQSH